MKIALAHNHYEENKVQEVKEGMKQLGAPKIKAVWMDCYGHWAALEGCHRLRAAHKLGIWPEIEEIDYSDEIFVGDEEDYLISDIADESYQNIVLDFDEEK